MTQDSIVPPALIAASIAVAATPVSAQTYQAQGFARNLWSTVSFLDQSSRLALQKSRSRNVKDFARDEAAEQTAAANALAAWIDSTEEEKRRPRPVAGSPASGSLVSMPFRTAATVSTGMADAIDGVQTGRSVAVATDTSSTTLKTITVPSFRANLERLGGLSGRAFDAFYRTSQVDALLQLSTLYASYIQHGDDPGLRALAVRELPKINSRLALVKSLR